ncbi:MAG: TetR/AcrR family transcriptional regulator [Actinomycetota bacterium]
MPGLRERKKQETFAEIVDVAERQFQKTGFEATTVETIASAAGVSPGTVYNYFGTKSAVLLAVVTKEMDVAIEHAASALDLLAADPVDGLMPVIDAYVDSMLALGRDVLRELFRTTLDPGKGPFAEELMSLDERALVQIAVAIGALQLQGSVSAKVDQMEAAYLVYSLIATAFIVFMAVPDTTPDDVKSTIRRQLTLAFTGLIRR